MAAATSATLLVGLRDCKNKEDRLEAFERVA
jgi:hypothetical protein